MILSVCSSYLETNGYDHKDLADGLINMFLLYIVASQVLEWFIIILG